ncbi:MAG: right-handed parallel beta-helix repeat-containing protein [Bacteroidales bacterium]|nr:right-handed parallel beta-helix repeat-containing protein [Bacteroidales bacterium]
MNKLTLIFLVISIITRSLVAQNNNNFTKQQSDNLVLNVLVTSDLERSDVYSLGTPIGINDTIWQSERDFITSPYNTSWVYFIDDYPLANWAHPCRYYFVDATNGNYHLLNSKLPPKTYFTPLSLFERPTDVLIDTAAIGTPMIRNVQENPHLFAVLICGTENYYPNYQNEYRFRNDVSAVYSTLINVYGYGKNHIYVLFDNGHSDYGDDLDGDGVGDINFNANKETITNIFNELSGKANNIPTIPELNEDDQLFIYVDDHGGFENGLSTLGTRTGNYCDTTMARDLEQMKCAQMIVMLQPCESGGFPIRLTDYVNYNVQCQNRSVHTAANFESSWSESILTNNNYCEFTYYWVAAVRGYYPHCNAINPNYTYPWNNSSYQTGNHPFSNYPGHSSFEDFDPDINGDGYIQMEEAFNYADAFDRYSPYGFYYPENELTIEHPQQRINIGFDSTDPLLTLGGLAGHVTVSQVINNRNYLWGGFFTIDQGNTITFNNSSKIFVREGNEFTVQNNSTLNIKGLVKFGAGAGLTVIQGGTLNIDGGHLANWDDEQWRGILVLGNNLAPQLSSYQGNLNIANNALIEDSEIAIDLCNLATGTSGGMVFANNSTFTNNSISLNLPAYNYSFPSTYNSKFSNCLFTIDDSYLGRFFPYHVCLENVKGIEFEGCRFQMNNSGTQVDLSGSCGVFAYNASPIFTDYCLTSSLPIEVQNCSFDHFPKAAIYSISDLGSMNTLIVRNAVFSNNTKGIQAKNLSQVTVVSSDFLIGGDGDCSFGVVLENTPYFTIENNSFNPVKNTYSQTYGIYIKDSNAVNRIHNNAFSNLYCANLAEGQNWMGKHFLGLEYTCNSNSFNTFDFYVLKDPIKCSGIQISQGNNNTPTRNSFSNTNSYQFYNSGDYIIDYYYNSNYTGESPDPNSIYHLSTNNISSLYDCLTDYANERITLTEAELLQQEQIYNDAYCHYTAIEQLYESRIDGGNTHATVTEIKNASGSDIWRLRAQLLGSSPYLSRTVLITTAERNDIFTIPVLMEILSANPEELKEDTLINYLETKELLPDYAVSILQQVAFGTSYRTAMQQQMGYYRHKFTEAALNIIRSLLSYSVVDYTTLRRWLGCLEDINADRAIIATYLDEGDSIRAFSLASLLPELYKLEGKDLYDHFNYIQLLVLYQNLNQSKRSIHDMTDTEINLVNHIADYDYGVSKSMAEGILDVLGKDSYTDCPILSSTRSSKGTTSSIKNQVDKNNLGLQLVITPNPATNWISLDYQLPQGYSDCNLVITSTTGIVVSNILLKGNIGNKIIDISNIEPGVYILKIYCGTFLKIEKFVKTK